MKIVYFSPERGSPVVGKRVLPVEFIQSRVADMGHVGNVVILNHELQVGDHCLLNILFLKIDDYEFLLVLSLTIRSFARAPRSFP